MRSRSARRAVVTESVGASDTVRKALRLKTCSSVYGRVVSPLVRGAARIGGAGAMACVLLAPCPVPVAQAQGGADPVVDAQEAFRKKDRNRLAAARVAAAAVQHPLAMWIEYWELSNRLPEASQAELDGFYQRWAGSYVE